MGENNFVTLSVMADVGRSCRKGGRFHESVHYLNRALEILCTIERYKQLSLMVRSDLVIAYLKLGLVTEALELVETELDLIPTVPNYNNADAAAQIREIASGLRELGHEEKAMELEIHLNAMEKIEGCASLEPNETVD